MKVIYAIFDRKTGSCALVKEAACLEEFERWFATVFLRSDAMFALYPADFDISSFVTVFTARKKTYLNILVR